MQIISSNDGLLTNLEVLELIQVIHSVILIIFFISI